MHGKQSSKLGRVTLIRNSQGVFGPNSEYWHVKLDTGFAVQDFLLTTEQYAEAIARAERGKDYLPQLSAWQGVWMALGWLFKGWLRLSLLAILAVGLAGCGTTGNQAVPSSLISGNLQSGKFSLMLPKDGAADSIVIDRSTTNLLKVEIKGLKVQNNPEVVASSYAGQVQLLSLQVQTLQEMVKQLTLQMNQAAAAYVGRYQPLPITNSTNPIAYP